MKDKGRKVKSGKRKAMGRIGQGVRRAVRVTHRLYRRRNGASRRGASRRNLA